MKIKYKTYTNLYDQKPIKKELAWHELKTRADTPLPYNFQNKNHYPLWNFLVDDELYAIVLDYDNGGELSYWHDVDFDFLIHQTLSSKTELPRYRAVVPLREPIPVKEATKAYYELWAYMERTDGLKGMDYSCSSLDRRFFQPAGGKNLQDEKYWTRKCLAANPRLWEYRNSSTDFTPPKRESGGFAGRVANQGRNTTLGSMCSAMIYNGEPFAFIVEELLFYDAQNEVPLFTDPSEQYFAKTGDGQKAVEMFVNNYIGSIKKKKYT